MKVPLPEHWPQFVEPKGKVLCSEEWFRDGRVGLGRVVSQAAACEDDGVDKATLSGLRGRGKPKPSKVSAGAEGMEYAVRIHLSPFPWSCGAPQIFRELHRVASGI